MILGVLGFLNMSFIDVLDIVMVALIIYSAFHWIKGSSAMNIFIAIIILLLVRIFAEALGMKMMSTILGTIIDLGGVALLVIFQPEIRKFLNRIGRSAGTTLEKRSFLDRMITRKDAPIASDESIDEIVTACMSMSKSKTGALIVLRHRNRLEDIIGTGDVVDAQISSRLLMNIFFKNSPLHDGAVVIGEDRIIAARCTLPITDRDDIPAHFGMRHKAAFGVSEQNDVDVLVVSEQTGQITFFRDGQPTAVTSRNILKLLLLGQVAGQTGSTAKSGKSPVE